MLSTTVLLGASLAACGGAGDSSENGRVARRGASSLPAVTGPVAVSRGATSGSRSSTSRWPRVYEAASYPGLRDDGDVDPVDGRRTERGLYHDRDDLDRLGVGYVGDQADVRAIAALVRRYYALAARGEGRAACDMMTPAFAKGVPLDYGKLGAAYLRGAKTCPAVLALQFEHSHRELTASIRVTGVHFEHADRAYAMLGSKVTPASFIAVVREHGRWRIGALIGSPLP